MKRGLSKGNSTITTNVKKTHFSIAQNSTWTTKSLHAVLSQEIHFSKGIVRVKLTYYKMYKEWYYLVFDTLLCAKLSKMMKNSVYELDLLNKVQEKDVSQVLGKKKSKNYEKLLARANIPASALQYLPQMKAADKYLLGRQSERLYHKITVNYENKRKRKGSDSDSDEDGEEEEEEDDDDDDDASSDDDDDDDDEEETSDDEFDDDSEVETSGDDSSSLGEETASSSGTPKGRRTDTKFNKLQFVLQKVVEEEPCKMLPKDEIAKSLSEDPDLYSAVDMAQFETETIQQDLSKELAVPAMPGSAAQPNTRTKSRGAENFFNYIGRWEAGKPHGNGLFHFVDNGKYIGNWNEGYPHAEGRSEYSDGSVFQGRWKNGKKHGQGLSESPNGTVFEGAFEHGHQTGTGRLSLPCKGEYEGDFIQGRFHGRGTFRSRIGWVYTGFWVNGFIFGSGVMIKPDGERIVRNWKPARTFGDAVRFLKNEERDRKTKLLSTRRKLRQALDDMNLQRHVRRVRQNIIDKEQEELEKKREEMDRLRKERREELQKAKEDMLRAQAGEEPEDADDNGNDDAPGSVTAKKKSDNDDNDESESDSDSD